MKKYSKNVSVLESSTVSRKVLTIPENYSKCKPIWRFDMLDRDGYFAFDLNRADFNHKEVLAKLVVYGNMTWQEINQQTHDKKNRSKNHFLDPRAISSAGKVRIRAKKLEEDSDDIYSLALQNTLRIIGFKKRR